MANKYFTYRPTFLNQWAGRYTPSYFTNQQYSDYVEAWLTSIQDCLIWDNRYTKETIPWIKNLRRFGIMTCNEQYINPDEFANNLLKIGATFNIILITNEEAKQYLRDCTDLKEIEEGKFEISAETEFNGEIIPAEYLIID